MTPQKLYIAERHGAPILSTLSSSAAETMALAVARSLNRDRCPIRRAFRASAKLREDGLRVRRVTLTLDGSVEDVGI